MRAFAFFFVLFGFSVAHDGKIASEAKTFYNLNLPIPFGLEKTITAFFRNRFKNITFKFIKVEKLIKIFSKTGFGARVCIPARPS